jgi:hypothetical protein
LDGIFCVLTYNIMSFVNRDSLSTSLPICIPFISCCFIALALNSRTMLNQTGESGHPCLVPDFRVNGFSFSPLSMMLALYNLRYIPSTPGFLRGFIMKCC